MVNYELLAGYNGVWVIRDFWVPGYKTRSKFGFPGLEPEFVIGFLGFELYRFEIGFLAFELCGFEFWFSGNLPTPAYSSL